MKIDFDRLVLRSSPYWVWQVHENQSFIGRTVLRLKRETTGSISTLEEQEWASLLSEVRLWELWLSSLFSPDRFNYAQLGNIYPRLHVHAVPRYAAPRSWNSVTFLDSRWGHNWSPTPRSPISLNQTYEFARSLQETLDRFTAGQRSGELR